MPESDVPQVFAVTEVLGSERIDGGATLAVRFQAADGGEVVVLLAVRVGEDLRRELAEILDRLPASS